MILLAWLWLRYQPGSARAECFRERVGVGRAHPADRQSAVFQVGRVSPRLPRA